MKRRGFLGLLAGAAVAPFVPMPTVSTAPITLLREDTFEAWQPRQHHYRMGDTITVRLPQRWKAKDSLQPYLHQAYVAKGIA